MLARYINQSGCQIKCHACFLAATGQQWQVIRILSVKQYPEHVLDIILSSALSFCSVTQRVPFHLPASLSELYQAHPLGYQAGWAASVTFHVYPERSHMLSWRPPLWHCKQLIKLEGTIDLRLKSLVNLSLAPKGFGRGPSSAAHPENGTENLLRKMTSMWAKNRKERSLSTQLSSSALEHPSSTRNSAVHLSSLYFQEIYSFKEGECAKERKKCQICLFYHRHASLNHQSKILSSLPNPDQATIKCTRPNHPDPLCLILQTHRQQHGP